MSCASFIAGGLALLALLPATAVDSAVLARQKPAVRAPGGPHLMAFGGRSAEQRLSPNAAKLDAALADLTRHLPRVRREHALEDLHALSPAARFAHAAEGAGPLVAIDAVTRGDPARLKQALVGLGLEHPAVYANDVGGWLPVDRIEAAAALGELAAVRASMPHTRAAVTSQGDFAQGSTVVRANNTGLTGAGVTVGIISDSFDCYGVYDKPGSGVPASGVRGYAPFGFATDDATFDKANGYLPSSVSVLEEGACMQYNSPGHPAYFLPFADEGRGMMQIVHDVAPGAALAFYTGANTEADFASGIGALANAGATVIADDLGWYDEPFFQDGIVAQAIDQVYAKGVAYFSAAGNNGQLSYENSAPSFATPGSGPNNLGEMLLTFGMNGAAAQTTLPVNIRAMYPGEFIALIVEWDQPYFTGAPGSPGASSQIDLCVTGASANNVVLDYDLNPQTCTGPNALGADPVQVMILGNSAANNSNTAAQTVNIVIGLKNGSPQPGLIKLVVADDGAGSSIAAFDTKSPTIQGHPGAAGAAAVAAAFFAQTPRCGSSPAVLEYFSSAGGDPILFDTSGQRLAVPQQRQKPDFTGPDGVNTSFFGFPLAGSGWSDTSTVAGCQNDATYNNFFGTSAAAPHAAGVAALMHQANPALTPADIYGALRSTALPMGDGADLDGAGFIEADAALASLPPGPPTLTLAASTVNVGGSTTLTWAAYNVTSCTASGSWSGTQQPTGSLTITPMTTGTDTYTLQCTNPHGSAQNKATLTVQAASMGGGGGGGGLDALTLFVMIVLGGARLLRASTRGLTIRIQ